MKNIRHVPGGYWPVNDMFMSRRKGLLAKNERVVLGGTWGDKKAWYVPVGALGVSSIKMKDFVLERNHSYCTAESYLPGALMGRFELGSTVVVLFEVPAGKKVTVLKDGKVRVGEKVLLIE